MAIPLHASHHFIPTLREDMLVSVREWWLMLIHQLVAMCDPQCLLLNCCPPCMRACDKACCCLQRLDAVCEVVSPLPNMSPA